MSLHEPAEAVVRFDQIVSLKKGFRHGLFKFSKIPALQCAALQRSVFVNPASVLVPIVEDARPCLPDAFDLNHFLIERRQAFINLAGDLTSSQGVDVPYSELSLGKE